MAVKTSGFRSAWLGAVVALLQDGGTSPPSGERLITLAARRVGPTSRNDGYVTSRNNGGNPKDYEAGWRIIVEELLELLHAQGFVDEAGRWVGPTSGKVAWGGKQYTIRSADERQKSRDFNKVMLGASADFGEVDVLGQRGGVKRKRFEIHPLAHLLPQIPTDELAKLREDIEEHGVLMPLLMFEEKVLDGRHRYYLAATLGRPVRLEEFEGTEEEARVRIGSLNLRRRHLSAAQQAQLAIDLYLSDAEKVAAAAMKEGGDRGRAAQSGYRKPAVGQRGKTAAQIVSEKTGGAVRPRAVEAMKTVQQAPKTLARVRSGEVSMIAKAEKEAREELGPAAPPKVDAWKSTINTELGRALSRLRVVQDDLELELGAEPATIVGRLDEIVVAATAIREALAGRDLL